MYVYKCVRVRVQIINRLQLCFVALFPKIVYSQQFEEWKSSQQWWNRVVLLWWFSNHCHSAQTMPQLEWSQATLEFRSDEITSNLTKTKQSPAVFLWTPFFAWVRGENPAAVSLLQLQVRFPLSSPRVLDKLSHCWKQGNLTILLIRLGLLKTPWHSKISSLLKARQLWPKIE